MGSLIDDLPLLTHAHVRPYIIAILLHRGAVQFSEVVNSIAPHCPIVDLRISDDYGDSEFEKTRLELLVEEVLGEMVSEGILRYNNEMDIWVLSLGDRMQNVPKVISWASTLGGQFPHHLTLDLADRINHVQTSTTQNLPKKA